MGDEGGLVSPRYRVVPRFCAEASDPIYGSETLLASIVSTFMLLHDWNPLCLSRNNLDGPTSRLQYARLSPWVYVWRYHALAFMRTPISTSGSAVTSDLWSFRDSDVHVSAAARSPVIDNPTTSIALHRAVCWRGRPSVTTSAERVQSSDIPVLIVLIGKGLSSCKHGPQSPLSPFVIRDFGKNTFPLL